MLEIRATLSKIVRNFHLSESPNPDDQPRINASLVLNSENGIKIRVTSRNKV